MRDGKKGGGTETVQKAGYPRQARAGQSGFRSFPVHQKCGRECVPEGGVLAECARKNACQGNRKNGRNKYNNTVTQFPQFHLQKEEFA